MLKPSLSIVLPVSRLRSYWQLAKPGITATVVLTALTAYCLAEGPWAFWNEADFWRLGHLLLGITLSSAGGCALNMVLESEEDFLMRRTQSRPIPSGRVLPVESFLLGAFASSLGVIHLSFKVNTMAGFFAAFSLALYLAIYTPMKKTSPHCMFWGAVSGALPVMVGWSSVEAPLNWTPWALFTLLFIWQYPHLLALGFMYREDYLKAGFKTPYVNEPNAQKSSQAALIWTLGLGLATIGLNLTLPSNGYLAAVQALLYLCVLALALRWRMRPDKKGAGSLFLSTLFFLPSIYITLFFY
jgi:heme o synthase